MQNIHYLIICFLLFLTGCFFLEEERNSHSNNKCESIIQKIITDNTTSKKFQINNCQHIDSVFFNSDIIYYLNNNDVIEFNFYSDTCAKKQLIGNLTFLPKSKNYTQSLAELYNYYYSITEYYLEEPYLYDKKYYGKYADVNIIKYDGSVRYTLIILLE